MSSYVILSTLPTVYNDQVEGPINGVLVRFRIVDYNEVHEVRIPKLDADLAKQAIEAVVKQRDALAGLGSSQS